MKTLSKEDIGFMAVHNPEGFLQFFQRGIISREEFMAEVEALERRASEDQMALDALVVLSGKLGIGEGNSVEETDLCASIQELCARFVSAFGEDRFLLRGSALVRGLHLPDDEAIYLAHDDTLFHTGQCGFAITSGGVYCRLLAGKKTKHMTFEELGRDSTAHFIGDTLYTAGEPVAYISGADRDLKNALIELYTEIQKIVKGKKSPKEG